MHHHCDARTEDIVDHDVRARQGPRENLVTEKAVIGKGDARACDVARAANASARMPADSIQHDPIRRTARLAFIHSTSCSKRCGVRVHTYLSESAPCMERETHRWYRASAAALSAARASMSVTMAVPAHARVAAAPDADITGWTGRCMHWWCRASAPALSAACMSVSVGVRHNGMAVPAHARRRRMQTLRGSCP